MADIKAQYLEAKASGFSDSEIAQHLAGDNYQEAKDNGYSDSQILGHLIGSSPEEDSGPTKLQKLADKISGVMQAIDQPGVALGLQKSAPEVNTMQGSAENMFQRAGDATTDFVGSHFPNAGPIPAAAAGTLVSMANPENWITPKGGVSVQTREPAVLPPNEAAMGVQFTRPEISGDTNALSAQRVAQETPTGGAVLNPFKNEQAAQIEAATNRVQGKLGTSEDPTVLGNTIAESAMKEKAANHALSDALYAQVPKDTPSPVPEFGQIYAGLADELPASIKAIVKKHVQLEPNPVRPGDTGEFHGLTTETKDPGGSRLVPTGQPGEFSIENRPPSTTPHYGVEFKASPGEPTQLSNTPNLHDLMSLRSKLTAIQTEGGLHGFYATALKKALNNDIANLGNTDPGPLGQFIGNHVNDTLNRATNFYREMKQLENHPISKAIQSAPIEKLPDIVFKSGRVEDVQVAKAALGDAGFKAAQRSFFTDLLNTKDIGKALDKYNQNGSEFLQQALTGEQLNALQTIDALKKRAASAGTVAPMQGSSKMNMWLSLAHGMVTHPIKTVLTGAVLPYAAAKGMINTAGSAIHLPPAVATLTNASLGAASRPSRKPLDVVRSYIQKQRTQGPG